MGVRIVVHRIDIQYPRIEEIYHIANIYQGHWVSLLRVPSLPYAGMVVVIGIPNSGRKMGNAQYRLDIPSKFLKPPWGHEIAST